MGAYVDSSVLVKLYVTEPNSHVADALVRRLSAPTPLTHIQELEIRNAVRLKQGRGELTAAEAQAALGDFQSDIGAGRYERPAYDLASTFDQAEILSQRYAAATNCRSLDLLHVAAAVKIGTREFVSFDARQRAAAHAAGLVVLPI